MPYSSCNDFAMYVCPQPLKLQPSVCWACIRIKQRLVLTPMLQHLTQVFIYLNSFVNTATFHLLTLIRFVCDMTTVHCVILLIF